MNEIDKIFNPEVESSEECKQDLVGIVKEILTNEFPNDRQRQIVKVCHNRLQFCCPCCGDSAHDSTKKRGNIGLNGKFVNLYKCFNCGVSMSVADFLKKYYHKRIPLSVVNYISNKPRIDSSIEKTISTSVEIFNQENIDKYAISRDTFKQLLNLSEVDGSVWNFGHEYLKERCQYDFSKFLYSQKGNKLYLLNLTRSGKIFGVQIRSLAKMSNGPKYMTYSLSKIYSMLLNKHLKLNVEIPVEIDELSMVFNSLIIDYTKQIIVTEGPMDAFLLNNAIATCGASKEVPFAGEFKYIYDDDQTGRSHTLEKIKVGKTVFLWEKFEKRYDIPNAKKWDVNDIIKYCRKTGKSVNFYDSECWSDNLYDIISI